MYTIHNVLNEHLILCVKVLWRAAAYTCGVETCFCLWGQTAYMVSGRHDYYTSVLCLEPLLSVENIAVGLLSLQEAYM